MFKHLKRAEDNLFQKVTWFSNKIFIEKYKQLISMSEELIETTNYIIEGTNLKVNGFDGFILEVVGNITTLKKREETNDI